MRLWIAHITSHSGALADFHNFVDGATRELNKVLAEAVRDDNMERARGIAHEIKVYEDLKKSVGREMREQRAQVTYLDSVKGA